MGRANLCALCKDLLGSARVTAPFVEPLMKVFCAIRSDVDERIQEVAEIISEMRDPMQVSVASNPILEDSKILAERYFYLRKSQAGQWTIYHLLSL